jgi:hypothetical protein
MDVPKLRRRWFQYSLRSLLVVVTLCAFLSSWLAVKLRQAKRERAAAAALEELGGEVLWSKPSGPIWLRNLLGDDLFSHVETVDLTGTKITDAGLENLKSLSQLQSLVLWATKVTDSGLESVKGSSHLKQLILMGTDITDNGLESIRDLGQLERLELSGTHVTAEGIMRLKSALPNCNIFSNYR